MTSLEIDRAYVGNTQVEKIYLGADAIYEANPPTPTVPYVVDSSGNTYMGVEEQGYPGSYIFNFYKPTEATWTLYYNGGVVTASSIYLDKYFDCEGTPYYTDDFLDEIDYEVSDIDMGTGDESDHEGENEVYVTIRFTGNSMSVGGTIVIYNCPCYNWRDEGYESWEDCMCQIYGEECGDECMSECDGDPECECGCAGGEWDDENQECIHNEGFAVVVGYENDVETHYYYDGEIPDAEFQGLDVVSVVIGDEITSIGEYAFCDNDDTLSAVTLGSGLTYINGQAFQHAPITSITIPASVEYIGWNAFHNTELQIVIMEGSTPPELDNCENCTFDDRGGNYPEIYVPDGAVSDYQNENGWSDYAQHIHSINDL